jgi:hypothetical protein
MARWPKPRMLWHSNYWDGPLSGMAEYRGEMVWFECTRGVDAKERTFALYRPPLAERRELCRRHALFRKMVGKHCDYGRRHAAFAPDPGYMDDRQGRFWQFYEMALAWPKMESKDWPVVARVRERRFVRERLN